MPKDLIHFAVAERTAKLLSDTQYAPALAHNTDGLLLGSVFHDALFYAITSAGKPLEKLAHELHGADGQDTYTLIRLQALHAAETKSPMAAALLVGIISHVFADITMHPMVWHFTGDYYAEDSNSRALARQRHRAMESLMDMTACPEKIHDPNFKLRRMLSRQKETLNACLPISAIAKRADMPAATVSKEIDTSWRLYAALQTAYCAKPLSWLLGAIRPLLPHAIAEFAALFYLPQLNKQRDYLLNTFVFRQPVTGEENKTSLNELMETAAQLAATLCRALEPTVFKNKPLNLTEIGPSMDTGLAKTATSAARFFATPPFPAL